MNPITSIVNGASVPGARTLPSTNYARLDEVVGEVSFSDASTFVAAAEIGKPYAESLVEVREIIEFTRWQSVNWDYSGRLQKAQLDVVELTSDTGFRLDPR